MIGDKKKLKEDLIIQEALELLPTIEESEKEQVQPQRSSHQQQLHVVPKDLVN